MNQQSEKIRQAIYDDLAGFEPTHHIPLQFDTNHKPQDIETLKRYTHLFMGRWQRVMLGRRWRHNHISFRMIAEINEVFGWHAHILLKDHTHSKKDLCRGFLMSKIKSGEPILDWLVIKIRKTPSRLFGYVMKHIWPDGSGRVDTSVWIPSEDLFDLPKKRNR